MIDRSKPLPIHEFPNLIDEVARLNGMAGRRRAIITRQKDPRFQNHALIEKIEIDIEVLHAAPALLDVLGEIRAGDAEKMEYCIRWLETTNINRTCIDMLHRYRDIAKKMEANR